MTNISRRETNGGCSPIAETRPSAIQAECPDICGRSATPFGTLVGVDTMRTLALGAAIETTRFHKTIGWVRDRMAANGARPAGGNASDRVSQQWIA